MHLDENQLAVRREQPQQPVDRERDQRPQEQRRGTDRAAQAPSAPRRAADDRAQGRAREHGRDNRRAEHHEADRRRRDRADDDRAQAIARRDRGHRHDRDHQQRATEERQDLADDRQHEREIREHDGLRELARPQRTLARHGPLHDSSLARERQLRPRTTVRQSREGVGNERPTIAMAQNVLGGELEPCSFEPLTGFYRDGCCDTGGDDDGVHTVCAVMTSEFLAFSREHGNDLSTPMPAHGFAGLVPATGGASAPRAGRRPTKPAPRPRFASESTHARTLEWCTLAALQAHAVVSSAPRLRNGNVPPKTVFR